MVLQLVARARKLAAVPRTSVAAFTPEQAPPTGEHGRPRTRAELNAAQVELAARRFELRARRASGAWPTRVVTCPTSDVGERMRQ